MFKHTYTGTFEAGAFKQGKLQSFMGEKLARTLEGVIDVQFASAPVAQKERVEESKEAQVSNAVERDSRSTSNEIAMPNDEAKPNEQEVSE
jgi:hypothetical protein